MYISVDRRRPECSIQIARSNFGRHSDLSVKITISDKPKDQTLNTCLNETMQVIFDLILKDPESRTIKSNLV